LNLDLLLVLEVQSAVRHDVLAWLEAGSERNAGGFDEGNANFAAFNPIPVDHEHTGAIVIAFHNRTDRHIRQRGFAR